MSHYTMQDSAPLLGALSPLAPPGTAPDQRQAHAGGLMFGCVAHRPYAVPHPGLEPRQYGTYSRRCAATPYWTRRLSFEGGKHSSSTRCSSDPLPERPQDSNLGEAAPHRRALLPARRD